MNVAMALGMTGRYAEAIETYRPLLPEADVHFNLGVICEARKDTARAAKEFAQADQLRVKQQRQQQSEGAPAGRKVKSKS